MAAALLSLPLLIPQKRQRSHSKLPVSAAAPGKSTSAVTRLCDKVPNWELGKPRCVRTLCRRTVPSHPCRLDLHYPGIASVPQVRGRSLGANLGSSVPYRWSSLTRPQRLPRCVRTLCRHTVPGHPGSTRSKVSSKTVRAWGSDNSGSRRGQRKGIKCRQRAC